MRRIHLVPLLCLLLSPSPVIAASCDAVPFQAYRGTQLFRFPESTAYFYVVNRMSIDADGAPNAYHPQDTGLDALANAGFPNGAWRSILVVDPRRADRPFVQPDGEFAGFFVSMTTLQDRTLPVTDVRRYVDATRVPYLVFPGAFFAMRGTGDFGDLGAARQIESGKESAFIVADAGPRNDPLGEVSIRLAESLGGRNVNPRNGTGAPRGPFVYVVFPRSKSQPPWPVTAEQLQQRVQELLTALGGWERILPCIQQP
ncbi:MAG TPA: hypothetical protein VHC97_24005 [Thermoanaerobaculia bacterium]|jgi:hypothetical protein|nr:hypothetical protein [Thermoanaerobaculia bacterium]